MTSFKKIEVISVCNGVLEKHNISAKEVLIEVHRMVNVGTGPGVTAKTCKQYTIQQIDDYIDETGILR